MSRNVFHNLGINTAWRNNGTTVMEAMEIEESQQILLSPSVKSQNKFAFPI